MKKLMATGLISLCCHFFALGEDDLLSYYEILDVPNTASAQLIQQAYRVLAWNHHPDHQNAEDQQVANQRMAEINQAYSVLKHPEMRRQYDRLLNHTNIYGVDSVKTELYNSFEQAISSYNEVTRAIHFYIISVAKGKLKLPLNDQQVHSILRVVVDIGGTEKFVREAAIIALENYVDQLWIEDIDLLLLLSSSKNKIDNQGMSTSSLANQIKGALGFKQSNGDQSVMAEINSNAVSPVPDTAVSVPRENAPEEFLYKRGIKQIAKEIVDRWFQIYLQKPFAIDQMIQVIVDKDRRFRKISRFRKKALDLFESGPQRLNSSQVATLQQFDHVFYHSRRLKQQVARITGKKRRVEPSVQPTEPSQEERMSIIRSEREQMTYAKDPELYSIQSLKDSIDYLNDHYFDLSPQRVQQIADHTLAYIHSLRSSIHFIRAIDRLYPKHNKEALIDRGISFLRDLTDAQLFINSLTNILTSHHFEKILDQIFPFIESNRGIRGGNSFLHYIMMPSSPKEESLSRIVDKLKELPVHKPEHANRFIEVAGDYLSEQDIQDIRQRSRSYAFSRSLSCKQALTNGRAEHVLYE